MGADDDHENPARSTKLTNVELLPQLEKRSAILVTGTPGTGKTTLTKRLSMRLRADYLNPEMLLTSSADYKYDMKRRTRIVCLERLQSLLRTQASRAVRGIVVDSHIALKIGSPAVLAKVIVLRCDPVVLEKRLAQKDWPRRKIAENVLAEILDVCLWDAVQQYSWQKISEIDTTHKCPKEVLELAVRALKQKTHQKKPKVNWLSTLEREGILYRYLS